MKPLDSLKSVLRFPRVFNLYQTLVGEPAAHRRFIREYVRPEDCERAVDFGCGIGIILDHLPERLQFLGVDSSAEYIAAARARYGDRGTFVEADLHGADLDIYGEFDVGMAYGVLHHLDDATVTALVRQAKKIIRPGGRLLTLDPVYAAGQSWLARFLIDNDRGKFVRDEAGYRRLLEPAGRVETQVVSGMLRVPYTEVICTLWV